MPSFDLSWLQTETEPQPGELAIVRNNAKARVSFSRQAESKTLNQSVRFMIPDGEVERMHINVTIPRDARDFMRVDVNKMPLPLLLWILENADEIMKDVQHANEQYKPGTEFVYGDANALPQEDRPSMPVSDIAKTAADRQAKDEREAEKAAVSRKLAQVTKEIATGETRFKTVVDDPDDHEDEDDEIQA